MTTTTDLPDAQAPYRDPTRPVPERVSDLLQRMTMAEKVAQLGSAWSFELTDGDDVSTEAFDRICRDGLGQVTRISGASSRDAVAAADVANQVQRLLIERTRLGIPAIVHEEICSGVMARGSTAYPQAIGVAATFEPEMNAAIAASIRTQMRMSGAHQGLSPVLDVCRDPRWGRSEETFGEDPYLVARMGNAFVRGLQGSELATGVIATAKHFVGYGASEGGMNWAPAHLSPRELREVYLHPFEAAVGAAGLRSLMNGYHELDGIPCAANRELLRDLLRGEWGFDGLVVSDYFSIDQLATYHRLAEDKTEAATIAIDSGIDVELPSTDCYSDALLGALADGRVGIAMLDEAVARTLRLKFELGLFERPYVDVAAAGAALNTAADRALAADVARKSIVLLENRGILPLRNDPGSIAVIGPNAAEARNLYGGYSYPAHIESLLEMRDGDNVFAIPIPPDLDLDSVSPSDPTVLDALRARYGDAITYARGCGINDSDTSGIAHAAELAAAADVVVLVVGDKAGLTYECTSGESRDRSSLDLPGVQEELAGAVLATGTPVVTVLIAGRPCGSEQLHRDSAAVLLAWLPGQEGGSAVADVLSGEFNPGGKLPISFPRNAGQIPVFYAHKVSGGRSHWKGDYVDGAASPLYPFGFGLSYSQFRMSDPRLDPTEVAAGDSIAVVVSVTNDGDRDGDEVVQVYVRDAAASVTRPVLELKSFARVTVPEGATRTVRFQLPVAQLGFYDRQLRYVVEPGQIEVLVGTSSADVVSAGSVTITEGGPVAKAFDGTRLVR
jgi:beta-glucosidase